MKKDSCDMCVGKKEMFCGCVLCDSSKKKRSYCSYKCADNDKLHLKQINCYSGDYQPSSCEKKSRQPPPEMCVPKEMKRFSKPQHSVNQIKLSSGLMNDSKNELKLTVNKQEVRVTFKYYIHQFELAAWQQQTRFYRHYFDYETGVEVAKNKSSQKTTGDNEDESSSTETSAEESDTVMDHKSLTMEVIEVPGATEKIYITWYYNDGKLFAKAIVD